MRIPATLVLIACMAGPASAQSRFFEQAYCQLWPRECRPVAPGPPVKPEPPPAPKAAPAPAAAPAQPRVEPAPKQVAPAKVRKKARKPAPKVRKPVLRPRKQMVEPGPDLPWPCWMVRLQSAGKTRMQLKEEGRSRGIVLSPKQIRQAEACLGRT